MMQSNTFKQYNHILSLKQKLASKRVKCESMDLNNSNNSDDERETVESTRKCITHITRLTSGISDSRSFDCY
jgi:hypothetical protein